MSIATMVDNRVALEQRKAAGDTDRPAAEPGAGVPANVLNQLVAFIPTEIITLWVALIAILHDPKPPSNAKLCQANFSTYWGLAAGFAFLATLLTFGLAYRKSKDANVEFKVPWFQMAAAPIAFLAWAVALPAGPLRSACWYSPEAGAFVVLVATVALATAGYIFGQAKRFETV